MMRVVFAALKVICIHWKKIVFALSFSYALYYGYSWSYSRGYEIADAKWITQNDKQVRELNAKILKLEEASRAEVLQLKTEAIELRKRLENLSASFPIIIARDSYGKALKCNDQEIGVPYLGFDFTESWNRLNEEGAMK